MPHLHELLATAVTVIVRYHKEKLPPPSSTASATDTESATVKKLLATPHTEMMQQLTTLIEEAITAAKVETRRPLLNYVLHNVDLLRSFADRHTPLDDKTYINIKQQLLQFVVDIQTLLATYQSEERTIHYNQMDVKLFGLMRNVFRLYSLCDSGIILQNTLFSTLRLPLTAEPAEIERVLNGILDDHQRKLQLDAREAAVLARETAVQGQEEGITTFQPRATPTVYPTPAGAGNRSRLPRQPSAHIVPGALPSFLAGFHTNNIWSFLARQANLYSRGAPHPDESADESNQLRS